METVWINNKSYQIDHLTSGKISLENKDPFEKKVLSIIKDWESAKTEFSFNTSGSTGSPKKISLTRLQMIESAKSTLQFLNITGGTCLLCLNPDFIAGTMMVIRALVGRMQLIAINPSLNPLINFTGKSLIDLCAMVPLQLYETLKNPISREKFKKISNVLIGGADISKELLNKLSNLSNNIYHTFGMTETVSHIALKKISGKYPDQEFILIPGIEISTDNRGCLVIKGKITNNKPIFTNDLIEISGDHRFRWLGRIEHLINSGGIKIIVEQLEHKINKILLKSKIDLPFIIIGIPDVKFGETIGIIWEKGQQDFEFGVIKDLLKKELKKYEFPKEWRSITTLIKTPTNKINRKKSLEMSALIP